MGVSVANDPRRPARRRPVAGNVLSLLRAKGTYTDGATVVVLVRIAVNLVRDHYRRPRFDSTWRWKNGARLNRAGAADRRRGSICRGRWRGSNRARDPGSPTRMDRLTKFLIARPQDREHQVAAVSCQAQARCASRRRLMTESLEQDVLEAITTGRMIYACRRVRCAATSRSWRPHFATRRSGAAQIHRTSGQVWWRATMRTR
jgi:hypothetical protein